MPDSHKMAEPGNCRSCGKPIFWIKTKGKVIPVDRPETTAYASNSSKDSWFPVTPVHLNHFVTCPDRNKWRKPKTEGSA